MATVKAVIGEVRFSYLHVFEPYAAKEGERRNYSAVLLIPKSNKALVEQVKKAIKEAYNVAVTEKWGGKTPKDGYWFNPLQDGDEPKSDGEDRGEAYEGHYFLNAKSNNQPEVVDRKRQPIMSDEDMYSGCYGYASVAFGGFNHESGKKGISCFLNNLLKTRDGDPLGAARTNAANDFADLLIDDDEEL